MKNLYITTAIALICTLGMIRVAEGQSRKYISQFSHFQNYYNPGLTGYEGSIARTFVRNQWAGFEGAPKTYFLSAELDFGELSGDADPALLGKNAVGISLLHDRYGTFVDTELIASYASRIRLDANTNLRLGAGVNYNTVRLDGNAMTPEQAGDPVLGRYLNSFADMHILDFNLGLALTHRNYYLSYGAHNVNRGAIQSGDVFMNRKPVTHIVQAGFRQALSKDFSVILNFMQRMQADLPDNTELNLKVLMLDRLWLGAGHRRDYANNFQLGLVLDRFRVGYIYELPSIGSYLLPNTTHEFTVVFNLFRPNERRTEEEVLIW